MPGGIGNIIGAPLAGRLSDRVVIASRKKYGIDSWRPEERLKAALVGALILVPLPVLLGAYHAIHRRQARPRAKPYMFLRQRCRGEYSANTSFGIHGGYHAFAQCGGHGCFNVLSSNDTFCSCRLRVAVDQALWCSHCRRHHIVDRLVCFCFVVGGRTIWEGDERLGGYRILHGSRYLRLGVM